MKYKNVSIEIVKSENRIHKLKFLGLSAVPVVPDSAQLWLMALSGLCFDKRNYVRLQFRKKLLNPGVIWTITQFKLICPNWKTLYMEKVFESSNCQPVRDVGFESGTARVSVGVVFMEPGNVQWTN